MYKDKRLNNCTISFSALDREGRIVIITPKLFVETACVIAKTDKYGLSKIIAASSSSYRKKHLELLDEKRLPTVKEFFSFCRLLDTYKADFVRVFTMLVNGQITYTSTPKSETCDMPAAKTDVISSNGTKVSDVNTLNFQFTWPKNWGENVEEIGSAICEIFRSRDFENDSLFCNYTESNDTVTVAADSGKFESAQSFGRLIEALRTTLNYIYINSPFDASVNELDEPIYKLVDGVVYNTLHEVALNGVEEVDLAPLQKYLYHKGIINLPNVKDDRVNQEEEDEYITFKFKVHKDTLEQFKCINGGGKTEVTIDPASYTDSEEYNHVVAMIRSILRNEYVKLAKRDLLLPEALIKPIWEMMYEEEERAAFWQLYNLVMDEHTDYNGKLYKDIEDYIIRKGLAVCKSTSFNLESIKKENINSTINAIAKMVADYIGFDVKDVVFTLFHDCDILTSTGDSDRLDTIARHSRAWYNKEFSRKQNTATEAAKSDTHQQNTFRPTVTIESIHNVDTSAIKTLVESFNGNVDIYIRSLSNTGNIEFK